MDAGSMKPQPSWATKLYVLELLLGLRFRSQHPSGTLPCSSRISMQADFVARLGSINSIGGGGLSPPRQVHPFQIAIREPTQLGLCILVIRTEFILP